MKTFRSRRGKLLISAMMIAMLMVSTATFVLANLPGSTFESNDGNLVVNTNGNKDWANIGAVIDIDAPSGSNDNSFGGGSKEDNLNVNVTLGSIPPNKSDLTRFYVANEKVVVNGQDQYFLYLSWQRTNTLGTANMDFEFNQEAQPDLTTTGAKTLVRTANDILITFDFDNGGNTVTLSMLRWVTSGSASQCFSSNSLPCWGNRVNLSQAGFADGRVNNITVTDPLNNNFSLAERTFGEAAINLSGAGVFTPGACTNFGSAYLKSRSSTSFTSELKDFVAPVGVNISNCGRIDITKTDQHGTRLQGAQFTLYIDAAPLGGTRGANDNVTPQNAAPNPCTTDANGECSIDDVPFGDYWLVETQTPPGGQFTPAEDLAVSVTSQNPIVAVTRVNQRLAPNLVINKVADSTSVNAGEQIGYTITVQNTGSGTANNVVLNDALPGGAGLDWSESPDNPNCQITGAVGNESLSCAFGNLASGASRSVHIVSPTTFDSPSPIGNTGIVRADNNPPEDDDDTITVQHPDLSITKTADGSPVSTGDQIGFTIAVNNAGPGVAKSVTLNDPLPSGSGIDWTISPAYSGPGTCTITGAVGSEVLSCNFGDLAANANPSVHIVSATGTNSAPRGGAQDYDNTATVSSTNHPSRQDGASVTVMAPELVIDKFEDASPVNSGDPIGFTIRVTNSGPGTAKSVSISDNLPTGGANSGISWSTSTNGCSIMNNVLTCSNLGDLTPGQHVDVRVTSPTTYNSTHNSAGTYANTATAQATNHGPQQDSATIVVRSPNLTITKTADADTVSTGQQIGFTITVANSGAAGTGTAYGVALSDPLPEVAGFTWQISPVKEGCAMNGNTLECAIGDLAPGASFSVHVVSSTGIGSQGEYVNTATASASNHPNRQDNDTVTVQAPNLTVNKTAVTPSVSAGDPISFNITISNSGPGTALNVSLSDQLPTSAGMNWTVTSVTGSPGYTPPNPHTCGVTAGTPHSALSCTNLGNLAPGQSVTVRVSSPTTAASCGSYPNTAYAQASNHAEEGSNSATITVNCPEIRIDKIADDATVSAGDAIGYEIRVRNNGAGTASGVVVTDTLPTNDGLVWSIDAANSDAGCSINGGVLTCNFGSIAPNGSKRVHITSPTTAGTCGTVSNTARVTTSNNGADQATTTITVQCPALTIAKSAVDSTVNAGDPMRFDITVGNTGSGIARGVTLNDALPSGAGIAWSVTGVTGYGGYTPPGNACSINGSLNCSFGDLQPGESVRVRISSPTNYDSCGSYPNTATANATNSPNGGITSLTASITVQCPNLAITKEADAAVVRAGERIGFVVRVTNNGPGTASGVTISDNLPVRPGTSWSLDPAEAGCSVTSNVLSCSGFNLGPGQFKELHLVSDTTEESAGAYPNTATTQASNHPQRQAQATLTVQSLKIIVVVCTNDGYLYPSYVTVDGEVKVSIGPPGASPLCGTGGATFSPKSTGDHPANINIPATPVPASP